MSKFLLIVMVPGSEEKFDYGAKYNDPMRNRKLIPHVVLHNTMNHEHFFFRIPLYQRSLDKVCPSFYVVIVQ
jgi:hypothetical protein